MNWTERLIALMVGVVTIIITLVVLALFEARSEPRELCMDPEMRDRIRALALEGYDEGFKIYAAKLLAVYVTNLNELPNSARIGTQNSIRAYIRARELALKWNPPQC